MPCYVCAMSSQGIPTKSIGFITATTVCPYVTPFSSLTNNFSRHTARSAQPSPPQPPSTPAQPVPA
jgi:hypothetical protein